MRWHALPATGRSDAAAPRVVAVVAVLVVHSAALVLLLLGTRHSERTRSTESSSSTFVVLLPTRPSLQPEVPTDLPEPPTAPPAPRIPQRSAEPSRPQPAPITMPPTVAWHQEAALAARRYTEAETERERRDAALDPGRRPGSQESRAKASPAPFGWSHAATHRVEVDESGMPVLWINDRCVLVAFVIPFCALGKKEARGDLFEAMDPPPEYGDWKDSE